MSDVENIGNVMNILIISDSYPPNLRSAAELMHGLAVALQKKGHGIWVITSGETSGVTKEGGIRVIRVKTPPHHNVSFIIKGLSWLLMPRLFWNAVKKHCPKIDVAIVHSPPLPLAWVAEQAKKKYKAKYALNVQDIFPQNAIDLGVLKNKAIIKFFERMEQHAYASCDAIVTPSREHEAYLAEKRGVQKEKISVISHWVNIEPFEKAENTGKFRKKFGLENKFIIFFGGVIGPSQGLDILLRLGERIQKTHPDIVFLVCGDGSEKKRLVSQLGGSTSAGGRTSKICNVRFENWVSKEEYPFLLKEVDIGLISLTSKNTTPAVPAKLMGYLAAGLPPIGFLHRKSEAHSIIRRVGGLTRLYEREDQCLNAVIFMYNNPKYREDVGKRAREYAISYLSSLRAAIQLELIINHL